MFTNLKTRFMLVMIILVLMPFSAFAQINIKGTVVDGSGLPVIGASIFEKGTTNGTVSDVDGTFVLTAKENVTLVFSCIGYATQELPAAATMNVILAEDAETLTVLSRVCLPYAMLDVPYVLEDDCMLLKKGEIRNVRKGGRIR